MLVKFQDLFSDLAWFISQSIRLCRSFFLRASLLLPVMVLCCFYLIPLDFFLLLSFPFASLWIWPWTLYFIILITLSLWFAPNYYSLCNFSISKYLTGTSVFHKFCSLPSSFQVVVLLLCFLRTMIDTPSPTPHIWSSSITFGSSFSIIFSFHQVTNPINTSSRLAIISLPQHHSCCYSLALALMTSPLNQYNGCIRGFMPGIHSLRLPATGIQLSD